jgi:hypothetical protein
VFPIRVVPDDQCEFFQRLCGNPCAGVEQGLAIVGTEAQDDQIERTMTVQQHGKLPDSAFVLLKGIIKDGGPAPKALLYEVIILA